MLVRLDVDDDGIGTITLNRPEKLNALSNELSRELAETVMRVSGDRKVRAVVITGAGRAFSAGGDGDGMQRHIDARDWTAIRDILQAGATIRQAPHPTPQATGAGRNGPGAGDAHPAAA